MKKVVCMFFASIICVTFLACGQKAATEAAPTWQEQYDLGVRYLSEGNYEEAILAFTAAIEIDPKKADAYLGMAEVYIAQGNTDAAAEVLTNALAVVEDSAIIQARLDELAKQADANLERQTEEFDENGNLIRKNYYDEYGNLEYYALYSTDLKTGLSRIDDYNADGSLSEYFLEYTSEDGLTTYSDCYNTDGSFNHRSVKVVDENNIWLYSATLNEAGDEIRKSVPIYDSEGKQLGWDNFFKGELDGYVRHENGKSVYYDADGNVTRFTEG